MGDGVADTVAINRAIFHDLHHGILTAIEKSFNDIQITENMEWKVRLEKFQKKYRKKIVKNTILVANLKDKIVIITEDKGVLEYYFKSDKVFMKENNIWILRGLAYLADNFLGQNK